MFNVQGAKTEDIELEQSAEQDIAGPTHSIDANFLKDVKHAGKIPSQDYVHAGSAMNRESSSRFV